MPTPVTVLCAAWHKSMPVAVVIRQRLDRALCWKAMAALDCDHGFAGLRHSQSSRQASNQAQLQAWHGLIHDMDTELL